MPQQCQRGRIALRRLQIAKAKTTSWLIQQCAADCFCHGFPAIPRTKKAAPVFGQIRYSHPSQQRGHINVIADALNIDPDRNSACDGHHGPAAGVRKAEFDMAASGQTRLPVRAEHELKIRSRNGCAIRQNSSQRGPCANPTGTISLKTKARGTQFLIGGQQAVRVISRPGRRVAFKR